LHHPPIKVEPTQPEEVMIDPEPKDPVETEVTMEGDPAQVKVEEKEVKETEDETMDEDGLFGEEFDALMDPDGFSHDLGFNDQSMDWMANV
jgi:hypothetical protein